MYFLRFIPVCVIFVLTICYCFKNKQVFINNIIFRYLFLSSSLLLILLLIISVLLFTSLDSHFRIVGFLYGLISSTSAFLKVKYYDVNLVHVFKYPSSSLGQYLFWVTHDLLAFVFISLPIIYLSLKSYLF